MPEPLYPARYAREKNVERSELDAGLDELRRRGLVRFTEWVRDAGQGYASWRSKDHDPGRGYCGETVLAHELDSFFRRKNLGSW